MQYIFIVLSALFFIGCSPKYKVVSEYEVPKSQSAKACLIECQKQYGSCKEICSANLEICKTKAYKVAKQNFDRLMQSYVLQLERYTREMQFYELERELYYFNGFYSRGYGYYPRGMMWTFPFYMNRPMIPLRPTLENEIRLAEKQMCSVDCGCTKAYDECYVGCGGIIKDKEVCVENCPDGK